MSRTASLWLVVAFTVSFFAVGIPYWQIPYAKVSLPNTLMGPGLLVIGIATALTRAFGKAYLLVVILVVGAAVPAAVLARVAVDVARDPTSHNLWPFELVIAMGTGVRCSSAGGLIGSLPALLARIGSTDRRRPDCSNASGCLELDPGTSVSSLSVRMESLA